MTDHLDTPHDDHSPADTLTDTTPTPPAAAFTVEDVLEMAERVERTATICLAANLQGEWDRLVDELSTLVNPLGEVLDNSEPSAGQQSAEGRAIEISERLTELRREMAAKVWHVTFRAMSSDDFASFSKRHQPKSNTADHTDFYNRLICETAVSPTISMEQIKALRQKLGPQAIKKLIETASEVCTRGGLDVPKLPASLLMRGAESYES